MNIKFYFSLNDDVELSVTDELCKLSRYVKPELLVVFGPAAKTISDAEELLFRKFIKLWKTSDDPFRENAKNKQWIMTEIIKAA